MLLHELLVMTHSGMYYPLKCKRNHLTVLSLMKHKKRFHKCLFVCVFVPPKKCTVEISCNPGDLSRRLKICDFSIWCLSEASDSNEYLIWKIRNCSKNQPTKQTHKKTHNENKQEKPTNKQKTQKQKSKQKERNENIYIYFFFFYWIDRRPEHFPHTKYKPQSLI